MKFGYEDPVRADEVGKPGEISTQIIDRLRESDVVIADLTDRNPNVFYELALRHFASKPVIQFRGDEPPPFDVKGLRAIPYRIDDLDSGDEARSELRSTSRMSRGTATGSATTIRSARQSDSANSSKSRPDIGLAMTPTVASATSRWRLTRQPLSWYSPIALPARRRRACRLRDRRFRSR